MSPTIGLAGVRMTTGRRRGRLVWHGIVIRGRTQLECTHGHHDNPAQAEHCAYRVIRGVVLRPR